MFRALLTWSLAPGVVHLNEPAAVFEAMLSGWGGSRDRRLLADATIEPRVALVRRFTAFAESLPWDWTAGDVEDFTASLMSGADRLAPSTIRGYHLTLRLFCDYLLDGRYGWITQCEQRFGRIPSQVCHDYNTAAHLVEYEGKPGPATVHLRRGGNAVRLPRRPRRHSRAIGSQGRVGGVAGRADDQDRLRVRVAPPRAVLPRRRRSASEPADAGVGNLRRGPCPIREVQPRQRAAASHGAGRPGVRLGDRRAAPVGRAGPPAAQSRTACRSCG